MWHQEGKNEFDIACIGSSYKSTKFTLTFFQPNQPTQVMRGLRRGQIWLASHGCLQDEERQPSLFAAYILQLATFLLLEILIY